MKNSLSFDLNWIELYAYIIAIVANLLFFFTVPLFKFKELKQATQIET
jgi:hypothetical protein